MKIEFFTELNEEGKSMWFTRVDGTFQANSLKYNKDEAYRIYNHLKENGTPKESLIESYETDTTTEKA